jgi:hypothetical protein
LPDKHHSTILLPRGLAIERIDGFAAESGAGALDQSKIAFSRQKKREV